MKRWQRDRKCPATLMSIALKVQCPSELWAGKMGPKNGDVFWAPSCKNPGPKTGPIFWHHFWLPDLICLAWLHLKLKLRSLFLVTHFGILVSIFRGSFLGPQHLIKNPNFQPIYHIPQSHDHLHMSCILSISSLARTCCF